MTEQRTEYYTATPTAAPIPPIDTETVLGVKCVRVTGTQPWRERMVDLLDNMRGPRPRMAVIFWDGAAFQFRETNPPQRIVVTE